MTPCNGSCAPLGSPAASAAAPRRCRCVRPGAGRGRGGGETSPSIFHGRRGTRNVPVGSSTSEPRAIRLLEDRDRGTVRHRRHRDPQLGGQRHDLGGRVLRGPVVDDPVPLVPVHDPVRDGRPEPVLDEVGTLDHQQEAVELRARVGVEADVAVGRRFDRRGLEAAPRVRRIRAAPQRVHEVGGGRAGGVRHLRHREVDELARSAEAHGPRRRERGDRGVEAADPLHGAPARLHRFAAGVTAHRQRAALGLQGDLGVRPVGVRTVQAVGRDGDDDQLREPLVQRGRVGGESLRVGDQDVGAGEERGEVVVERRLRARTAGLTIERWPKWRKRNSAPSSRRVGTRPVALVGPAAQRVTLGRLDLDHVGPGVAQQLGAVPAGDPRRAVDHLQIREQIHRLKLPGSPRRGLGRPR